MSLYAQVESLVKRTIAGLGGLHIVVNNSGIARVSPLAEMLPEEFERTLSVNLVGVFNGCRAAAEHLITQKAGKVVNIASVLGQVGLPGYTAYAASKGGVTGFTRALAAEWARYNIQVNALAPGWFVTDMNAEAFADPKIRERLLRDVPARRTGRPEEVGPLLVYLASSASDFMSSVAEFDVKSPMTPGTGTIDARRGFESMYEQGVHDLLYGTGRETFEALKILKVANPGRHQPDNGARYPGGRFGAHLKQIAQLIKADIGLQVAFAEMGGWDTHAAQGNERGPLASRFREFADALAALDRDLGDRMTEEEEYHASLIGILELVKNGTVCFLDPGSTKFPDACLQAYEDSGIRVITGECVTDLQGRLNLPRYSVKEAVARTATFVGKWNGRLQGRIQAWAMPFSPETCSGELLRALKLVADEHKTGLTLHHGSGPQARADYQARHGHTPTGYLESIGVVGPNVLLAHALGIDDTEIDCVARTGTAVTMCPVTAAKGARGVGQHGRMSR